ncbi:MAG: HD domain-containing protein [Clostridia bacterium]|nr:HD domain-containing protein [Clostridia bacterium]
MPNLFINCRTDENNPDYEILTSRREPLYERDNDVRGIFERDYTRILHSLGYRRLKHKTQVFYNVGNDHICTRMEHVSHVESVSTVIAEFMGLSSELTRAIAAGHDIGHAPFGHQGERVLDKISYEKTGKKFWHEQNGLIFVDNIETLENYNGQFQPLNLTYAVRDGIISHCGEVDENGIKPRKEYIDLAEFTRPGQFQPATWEACVVKISDKIAYLGRDIEDALRLGILSESEKNDLCEIVDSPVLNTTVIMNNLVGEICRCSNPDTGICLGKKSLELMNNIKLFNYKHIYSSAELDPFGKYSNLILNQLFETLHASYCESETLERLMNVSGKGRDLSRSFANWLSRYCGLSLHEDYLCENIFGNLETIEQYDDAIIKFISGMTDAYAINSFNNLITF